MATSARSARPRRVQHCDRTQRPYRAAVSDRWELLEADAEERALFASLESTRTHISGPAAEPNRFRCVHRIAIGNRTWYLKEFAHTQWKNRCRSRLTAPRCRLDGEREQLVAAALAERGTGIARPVAIGIVGGASFYLCAGLEGRSLTERFAARDLDRRTALAAARFGGEILAGGVQLPDLSADHIFVCDDGSFAVIDLHNGSVASGPSDKTVQRVLRRFRKSIRGLAVRRPLALMFAVRMLRTAGLSAARRRRAIERTKPIDTHGRYEVQGRSHTYRNRNPKRTTRELQLLRSVWPGQAGDVVLDSPAGAGRLGPLLRDEFGADRLGMDRAHAMLCESRQAGDVDPLAQADAADLPLFDDTVNGAVVFRFLHHVDRDVAKRVVLEAARVARHYVVVSFFHPVSVHALQRRCKERLTGSPRTRFSITHGELAGWLRGAGFTPYNVAAEKPYLRDFWVASFVRQSDF